MVRTINLVVFLRYWQPFGVRDLDLPNSANVYSRLVTPFTNNFYGRAMKAKRRHELQTNQLADWLGTKVEHVKPYFSWIIGAVLLLIVAAIVVSIRSARQTRATAEGWERYDDAQRDGFEAVNRSEALTLEDSLQRLENVAIEHTGSPLEIYARLAIGDIHLESGANLVESNRSAAGDHFAKAAQQYEMVVKEDPTGMLKDRAAYNLAKSYEWQSKFAEAQRYYAMVEGAFRGRAQDQLAALEESSTKSFYEQFASWEPKPRDDSTGGSFDERFPEFSLDEDAPAEIDYQQYL